MSQASNAGAAHLSFTLLDPCGPPQPMQQLALGLIQEQPGAVGVSRGIEGPDLELTGWNAEAALELQLPEAGQAVIGAASQLQDPQLVQPCAPPAG